MRALILVLALAGCAPMVWPRADVTCNDGRTWRNVEVWREDYSYTIRDAPYETKVSVDHCMIDPKGDGR